jgi:hypothetical protein
MSKELFSINAAANLLERDRGTITRAVRDVPPDGHDKQGNARWKMCTIVAALGHTGGGSSRFTAIADNLEATGDEFLAALETLRATPDVAARRKLVCKAVSSNASASLQTFSKPGRLRSDQVSVERWQL